MGLILTWMVSLSSKKYKVEVERELAVSGTVSIKAVVGRLNTTQMYKYRKGMSSYFLSGLSKGRVKMPSLEFFFDVCPEYKKDMVDLYNGTFGLYEGVDSIPDDIKALQASVIDGFCYFYNIDTEVLGGICTMNTGLLGLDPMIDEKVLDKAFKANRLGTIHTLRVDFEFNNFGSEEADYKVVAHRTVIDESSVFLVPYIAGDVLCNLVQGFMDRGMMIYTKQEKPDGSVKERVVSSNFKHLANYCDDPDAVMGIKPEYYPLRGFIYAPVLGAPSTTAMLTRVDLFDLTTLLKVDSYSQCRYYGVQKPVDPVREVLKKDAILTSMAQLYALDEERYFRTVDKFPDIGVYGNALNGDISVRILRNYLDSGTRGLNNRIFKIVPGAEELYTRVESFVIDEKFPVDGYQGIKDALRDGIVKVLWKKANGMYASEICTNCPDILSVVYGEDYFRRYESSGVRLRNCADAIDFGGMGVAEALEQYGFDSSVADKVTEMRKGGQNVEDAMVQALGIKTRAHSSNPALITARTLSGYISGNVSSGIVSGRAEDYYVSIDTEHLVKAEVIGKAKK